MLLIQITKCSITRWTIQGFYYLIFIATCLNIHLLSAQTNKLSKKELIAEAEEHFRMGNFRAAIPCYERLNKLNPGDPDYQYNLGYCYLASGINKIKAIPYLEFAASNAKKLPYEIFLDLGKAYHFSNRFDEAIVSFEKFLNSNDASNERTKETKLLIQMCENAKKYVKNPVNVKIEHMGEVINSSYADYAPLISADETVLIFSSRRKGSKGGYLDINGEFYADIYYSEFKDTAWLKPKNIGVLINTDMNEVSVGLSAEGEKLIIFRDDFVSGTGDLFISTKKGKNWGKPMLLGEGATAETDVNKGSNETSACFTPDGEEIYFSSNRSGGKGGFDIWKAKLLPTGEWALATNLDSSVNTPYDEITPFMHPNGKTLYFSSNNNKSMGGYDIFKSTLDDYGAWGKYENVGFPINTSDDDLHFVMTANRKHAYYSSIKQNTFGEKDIYKVIIPEEATSLYILIHGFTYYKDTISIFDSLMNTHKLKDTLIPIGAHIKVFDKENEQLSGIYNANSLTGSFIMIFPSTAKYHIWVEANGYALYKEDIILTPNSKISEITKKIILTPLPKPK